MACRYGFAGTVTRVTFGTVTVLVPEGWPTAGCGGTTTVVGWAGVGVVTVVVTVVSGACSDMWYLLMVPWFTCCDGMAMPLGELDDAIHVSVNLEALPCFWGHPRDQQFSIYPLM